MCIGCKACAMACPYGAPQFNHESDHMSKCDGCYERLKEGKNPKEFAMVVAFIPSFFHLNGITHIFNVLIRMGVFYANNEWHIGWMNNEILFVSLVCALGFLLYLKTLNWVFYLTLICGILGLFFMSGAYGSMQESVPTWDFKITLLYFFC